MTYIFNFKIIFQVKFEVKDGLPILDPNMRQEDPQNGPIYGIYMEAKDPSVQLT